MRTETLLKEIRSNENKSQFDTRGLLECFCYKYESYQKGE